MTSFSSLTLKQAEILKFIESEIVKTGRPPTYRMIANHFGYQAIGTVQDHILKLIEKGFLKKNFHKACGIQLTFRSESKDIPILGQVPAGNPLDVSESILGMIPISARWKGELYALRVSGESM